MSTWSSRLLIWVMIYPMMIQIDFGRHGRRAAAAAAWSLTLVVNWLIKPFTMAALAVLFFEHLFAGLGRPAVGAANTSPA